MTKLQSKTFQYQDQLTDWVNRNSGLELVSICPVNRFTNGGEGYTLFFREPRSKMDGQLTRPPMRHYQTKADPGFDEIIIELEPDRTAAELREALYYHYDDHCFWAKATDLGVFYSRDELFSSEREQATHLVIFMK